MKTETRIIISIDTDLIEPEQALEFIKQSELDWATDYWIDTIEIDDDVSNDEMDNQIKKENEEDDKQINEKVKLDISKFKYCDEDFSSDINFLTENNFKDIDDIKNFIKYLLKKGNKMSLEEIENLKEV
jgi:hypothetical protein